MFYIFDVSDELHALQKCHYTYKCCLCFTFGGMMDLLELGELVKAARKEQKMTQENLSQISGVSRPTISAFEKGGMFDMNFSTVQRLVEGVGLTLKTATKNRGRPTFEELKAEKDSEFETPRMG
jgi:DNA-binding XRE family transcriptional regulator